MPHRLAISTLLAALLLASVPGRGDVPVQPAAGPAKPNPNHVNLVENIQRLKLRPERILPLHGRIVPAAELYSAAGKAL